MPLNEWLSAVDCDPSPSEHFSVCYIDEHVMAPPGIVRKLASSLLNSKTSVDFLRSVAPILDWEMVSARIAAPSQTSVRRGDFGEILTEVWLSEHDGLEFPYHKGRHNILPKHTQPGADLIGIERNEGSITRLHMVETKLRTTSNTLAGCDAYEQHFCRSTSDVDGYLMFMLEQLYSDDNPVFQELLEHLKNRREAPNDAYDIALVYERDRWSHRTLVRFDEVAGSLSPLHIHVIRVSALRALIDKVFVDQGSTVVDDIDDIDDESNKAEELDGFRDPI